MLTIWKFAVLHHDEFKVSMPKGAEVLSVGMQGNNPYMWALVDADAEREERTFYLRGTGHSADGLGFARFIGTFIEHGGALIFHLFEPKPPPSPGG